MSASDAPEATADNLTDEQIVHWWNAIPPDARLHEHACVAMTARGMAAGPCYRKPTTAETQAARQCVADAINARAKEMK